MSGIKSIDGSQLFQLEEELNIVKRYDTPLGEIIVKYPSTKAQNGNNKSDLDLLKELIRDFTEGTVIDDSEIKTFGTIPNTVLLKDVFKLTTNLNFDNLDELTLQEWIKNTPPILDKVILDVRKIIYEIQENEFEKKNLDYKNLNSLLKNISNSYDAVMNLDKEADYLKGNKLDNMLEKAGAIIKKTGNQEAIDKFNSSKEKYEAAKNKSKTNPKQKEIDELKAKLKELESGE